MISVNQAGLTIGIAICQKVRISLQPSRRALSSTSSEIEESINCFIRYRPMVEPHAGIIIANTLSIRPRYDNVKKFAIAVTVEVNIRDFCINQNMPFLPGKGIFETAYAASELNSKLPNVPAAVINTVLNMYLEKGTQESLKSVKRSPKFLPVG